MKEKRKIAASFFIGVLAFTVVCCIVFRPVKYKVTGWEMYTVLEGETLCSIAQRASQSGQDWRAVVYDVEKHNDITPMIYAGQVIEIPVYEGR